MRSYDEAMLEARGANVGSGLTSRTKHIHRTPLLTFIPSMALPKPTLLAPLKPNAKLLGVQCSRPFKCSVSGFGSNPSKAWRMRVVFRDPGGPVTVKTVEVGEA